MDLIHQLLWYLKPEGITYLIQTFGMVGICLIIFAETGFFALLPGDSLLVLCGIFAGTISPETGQPLLPLWALLSIVPLCGIFGDQVGFWLGRWAGNSIYGWRDFYILGIPIFKRAYLAKTEDFYSRWGTFTIVAGRWVPIVRTFAPIVAGITNMKLRTFLTFNIIGAFTWVWSMVLTGYYLNPLILKFKPDFNLAKNIDKIALIIVFLSILPILFTLWKERAAKQVSSNERVLQRRHTPTRRNKADRRKKR